MSKSETPSMLSAFATRTGHHILQRKRTMILLTLITLSAAGCKPIGPYPSDAMTVYKSPTCGCCKAWIQHMENAGIKVAVRDEDSAQLANRRHELGIPDSLAACHTGVIGGYRIEGHVPAEDIRRLRSEKPEAHGLAAAGMPIGSPGMEQGNTEQSYQVILFDAAGYQRVFAQH